VIAATRFDPYDERLPMTQRHAAPPLVSVIVVNWNGRALLDACFEALERQTFQNKEFILVDNGSTDGSREILARWAERLPKAQAVLLPTNTGFCKGNNIAFAHAHGEWIALLNTDAVVEPDWLSELVRYGDLDQHIGMLASKILLQEPRNVIDKAGHLIYWDGQNRGRGSQTTDVGQFDRPEETLWPDACAALYHRRVFEETGGFDEEFFAFGDDADLGMRARLLGWKAWYVPSAVVHHRHSASFGVYSPLKVMLVERNRVLLAVKSFPWRLLVQNPFWTSRRFLWNAFGLLKREGAASRFLETNGWRRTMLSLLRSYLGALKLLPGTLRKRQVIQRTRRLSNNETLALLRRFQIDIRELTLRD
jgi:GT2 family glycosyltransferase